MKSIRTNPRRGDIYDCVFGNYEPIDQAQPDGPFKKDSWNTRIPNEIRKRRPVVIIGERKDQFIVIPISSSRDEHKKPHRTAEALGLHILLDGDEIPETAAYPAGTHCWAKTDLIQTVDEKRLREFRCPDGIHRVGSVTPEKLRAIQEGVMRCIGLTPWVLDRQQMEADLQAARAIPLATDAEAPVGQVEKP